MKAIWKFPISIVDEQIITMPTEAEILCVQWLEGYGITIWAKVNPESTQRGKTVKIYLHETRHSIQDEKVGNYIGTVQDPSSLVWHIFEERH